MSSQPEAMAVGGSGVRWSPLRRGLRQPEFSAALLIAVCAMAGGLLSTDVWTTGNVSLLLQGMVPHLIVGLGASIALYAGIIDLSIGSTMGAAGMTFALVSQRADGLVLPLAAGIVAGIGAAAINGLLIVGFAVRSLVATLATLLGIQGATYVISDSTSQLSYAFSWDLFVARQVGTIPVLFIATVVAFAAATLWIKRTRPGRHLASVGGGPPAAERVGIRVRRIQLGCLAVCSVCAALGGVVSVGFVGAAPITLGVQDLFIVLGGIVLGGFSIDRGGTGGPIGAFLGIAALSLLLNVLSNVGVPSGWLDLATGLMLVVAVTLDRLRGTWRASSTASRA